MDLAGRTVVITGGAGHVGSHLGAHLLDECDVVVADDLSVGRRERVPDGARFLEGDLADPAVAREAVAGADVVFHLAVAEKDVAAGAREQFEANLDLTFSVLEAAIDADVAALCFASSSTVYGEDVPRPTPETHGPMAPISPYGAAKLAEEGILATAVESAGMEIRIARLANVVGPVVDGTVVPDFVAKLQENPSELEILGDGRQQKSFIHVEDVASALTTIVEGANEPFAVYNVGTDGAIAIREVADIVADVMGLDPTYTYTGGEKGWTGDVPRMELAVEKLMGLGWTPEYGCAGAVRRAAEQHAHER